MTVKSSGRKLFLNKKLTIILAGFLLMSATANAQIVAVDGYGPDRASALRDAERIAVENVVGTYIDSQTMVSQGQVALDDIYAKATGFVRNTNVISEGTTADGYTVKASIDVNTDGNSALISQLTAIRRLNDPRIAVVVLNHGQRDEISETAINERLIDMGFSHVVDANLVASLQDARLLEHVYNGGTSIHSVGSDFGVDFLVLEIGIAHV